MKKFLIFALALVAVILFSGCIGVKKPTSEDVPFIGSPENPLETPVSACVLLCNEKKDAGVDLSAGPCLSNEIQPNWVCDVAHNPRIPLDNDAANQCPAFNNGTAKHFVEVDTDCNLIRTR